MLLLTYLPRCWLDRLLPLTHFRVHVIIVRFTRGRGLPQFPAVRYAFFGGHFQGEFSLKKMESGWSKYFVDLGYYDPLMAGSIDGTDTKPHDRGIVRAMNATC